MVPEHAAAQTDALQIERDDQVVKRAPHDAAELVHDGNRRRVTALRCRQNRGRIGKPLRGKPPRQRVASHQAFHVAEVAAAAERVKVVADKQVPGVPGVALLAAQHMAINAQPAANAGTPRHVGAMIKPLQRTPAPFGLQRGNTVVFNTQV